MLGLEEVPTISLEHLSAAQIKAFMIADNRLTENATWDEKLLGEQLKNLSEVDLTFDLEVTGFLNKPDQRKWPVSWSAPHCSGFSPDPPLIVRFQEPTRTNA